VPHFTTSEVETVSEAEANLIYEAKDFMRFRGKTAIFTGAAGGRDKPRNVAK
jgi:hypothetical protein